MSYKVIKPLKTVRLSNQLWELIDDFVVKLDGKEITVPDGFVTNGASVPRIFWNICAPISGAFGEAAVVHDWGYSKRSNFNNKEDVDKILFDIGMENGASYFRALLVYLAVKIFGHKYWKKGEA